MSRTEKIVAFLLGALVFAGLFVFIFTAMRTPPAAPPLGDTAFGDEEEPLDFNEEIDTGTAKNVSPEEIEPPTTAPPAGSPKK